jgi:tyrosyl-tRNA synthetase
MSRYKSDLLQLLDERGYIHQTTDAEALDAKASSSVITGYIGFDCTAPSLHVGSLVQIMLLRRMQQTGHRPIALMGGGTTKVGDPSGKDEARKILTTDDINTNKLGIRSIFERFLTFGDGPSDALMPDNAEWLDELHYIPFLRDVGKHFSVNRMLTMDSVKLRLERDQPLSFLEFNYMILQSYDFLELNRRFGCTVQMGGSDQWGNIIMGVDLTRRMLSADVFGITTPLITTADGGKMGKTAKGAVWLNDAQLPAYDYWQFWRNTADADVGKFLKLFTDLPLVEISRLEKLGGAEINEAKKILANEATLLARGETAATAAADTAQKLFEQGTAGGDLPTFAVSAAQLSEGFAVTDALVALGLAASKSEARKAITPNNAVSVNDAKISDIAHRLLPADLQNAKIKLSNGKKRHGLIVLM